MESPAENKRSAVLALAALGVLLAGALVVLTVFDGEDDDTDDAPSAAEPTASAPQDAGSATGAPSSPAPGAVTPIVTPDEVVEAHQAMAGYMAGLNTYRHTDQGASWAPPLLALTTDDTRMRQETALPTGKEWDGCAVARCSSEGKATVVRDAMIADDITRGSGQMISSVVNVTATRAENGATTGTETNSWLVTAKNDSGKWKVSGFDLYGLGNVGSSDRTGD
ncbi:hypothetical protein [Streptomyces sp. cmx-18-6]|uniref:hypothetical protein n=1 Tax=Streptomyces sp. cmx-18-6 TaxID=2790930 RepID=UPI0039800C2E